MNNWLIGFIDNFVWVVFIVVGILLVPICWIIGTWFIVSDKIKELSGKM